MTGSRHYLFTLWEGGGTVPPAISLAQGLIQRGHRVTVLGDPTMQAEVHSAGAAFRSWRSAPHRLSRRREHDLMKDYELGSPLQLAAMVRRELLVGPAARFAADVHQALDADPADAVVSDCMIFGAQIAAEARKLPLAVLLPNAYFLPARGVPPFGLGWQPARGPLGRLRDRVVNAATTALWNKGLPELNAIRAAHRLPALTGLWQQLDRATRALVLSSAAFDFPGDYPPNVRHVGAVLDDPCWAEPCALPAGDAPLVLVGFSSTFQNQAAVLQRIADALGRLPVRAILTTGHALEPDEIRSASNVKVVATAPHREILRHAALCITHGGHGTLLKALARGVPVICMPMGRDQPDNAARLCASGAGIRLSPRASAARIQRSIEGMLHDPAYRAAAQAMQARLAEDEQAGRALSELEALPPARHSTLSGPDLLCA
jgi:MGT family glycosyltransferase